VFGDQKSEIEGQRSVISLFDYVFGKLAWRVNLHTVHGFAVQRSEMCLIAANQRIAFKCNRGGKNPAVVLWQWRLEPVEWQVWEFRRAVDFSEQAFEISDSFSLLEKEITMRFANDVLVRPTFVSRCASDVQKLSKRGRGIGSREEDVCIEKDPHSAGLAQSFAAKELLQLLLSALELGNTLGAVELDRVVGCQSQRARNHFVGITRVHGTSRGSEKLIIDSQRRLHE
jgi:hypothetical protein